MQQSPSPRACLVSVGGSPEPVLHTLRTNRPALVAYFCSAGSRPAAEAIQASLDFAPAAEFLEVATHEELGPCYSALRSWLPDWLARHGLQDDEVVVDYTGGTKTMSAALVLAATEHFSRFSYIGGTQRDKAGTGVVLSGSERIHYQGNPWRELAVRELDRAATLWTEQQYTAAAAVLRAAKRHVPMDRRRSFESVVDLAGALANRLSLQYRSAAEKLEKLATKLRKHPPSPEYVAASTAQQALLAFCDRASARFRACDAATGPAADPRAQLRELLDNALLTAELGRYDDAAARLYRALELHGQNELSRLTDGAFRLGQLKTEALPSALAGCPVFDVPDPSGKARRGIALEEVYRVLAHFGHPTGARAVADFDGPNALNGSWRQATQRRNQSILAHGIQPVGDSGFRALAELVASYTGEGTSTVDLPAPAFNYAWF